MTTARKNTGEPSTPDVQIGGEPVEYATERKFYEDLGLPYCEKCYRPLATDLAGKPMCQVGADTCPLVQQE